MNFIRRFFANDITLAEDIEQDDLYIRKALKELFDQAYQEEHARNMLVLGAQYSQWQEFFEKNAQHELALIEGSEKSAQAIADELNALVHHEHAAGLNIIIKALGDVEAQERLAYHLMDQLLSVVEDKAHTINALGKDPGNKALLQTLLHQLQFQSTIVGKMKGMKDFHVLFHNLALGTRQKYELTEEEADIARGLEEYMFAIEKTGDRTWTETYDHDISKLTANVFTRIHEMLNEHMLQQGIEMDREEDKILVQSPRFERIVQEEMTHIGVKLSDKEFKAYITAFRGNFLQR